MAGKKKKKADMPGEEEDGGGGSVFWRIFSFLAVRSVVAAMLSNISDCDETYNYWEPLHFLLHGTGYQTWEYSPQFAIRSWAYIGVHGVFLYPLLEIVSSKVTQFYILRGIIGTACSLSEAWLCCAIRSKYGSEMSRIVTFLLFSAPGMFIACTAFLPSSFAMFTTMSALAAWISGRDFWATFFIALGAILGWPFAGALGIPIFVDLFLVQRKFGSFILHCIISLILILGPIAIFDTTLYNKVVIAPLNILMYNVFAEHDGSQMYGVEPWFYYVLNGVLNFNVTFLFALLSLPLCVFQILGYQSQAIHLKYLAPLWIWLAIFVPQPHKEERFLFPVYPLIVIAGASAFHSFNTGMKKLSGIFKVIAPAAAIVVTLLSVSRILALYHGYHAPLGVYESAYQHTQSATPKVVCVGKEWYRYPSNFFLPENAQYRFIESEFRGQLPQPFAPGPDATSVIQPNFNDLNQEEPSRYVALSECDFLIDVQTPRTTNREPDYAGMNNFKKLRCVPFMDAAESHRLFRAFYLPGYAKRVSLVDYCLLQQMR